MNNEDNKNYLLIFAIIGLAIISFVILYGVILKFWPDADVNFTGPFGDSFGPLTSLFSGLAFCGIIVTIIMQREELRLQRREVERSTQVLRDQTDEFKVQVNLITHQNFDSTFFELIDLHGSQLDRLSILEELLVQRPDIRFNTSGKTRTIELHGIEVFAFVFEKFKQYIPESNIKSTDIDRIGRCYQDRLEEYDIHVEAYVASLRGILDHIDSPPEATGNKIKLYKNIVKNSLSIHEVYFLFFYCLSKERDGLKDYIKKYDLLSNFKNHKVLFPVELFDFFNGYSVGENIEEGMTMAEQYDS